ncbi:HPr family phosphocarrier protein [Anaerotalea alkaliphila]|uniref:Phosphocarrier protein HPr n=1 Tax=Anaerotalea alkaliphila TaxID=2662126 RepID=A0A7X5KNB0_9FIRM|nr:HPr family phosphocarrier protein [Anaerotalea alkaliphila]NDL67844.1 HPr family phosphocarrier protein [Anaerotalea alkaliphila]
MAEMHTKIKNKTGLHARPASAFTEFCKGYPNEITLLNGEKEINPKSIISILAGGISKGTELKVVVEGEDAGKVCREIAGFLDGLEG